MKIISKYKDFYDHMTSKYGIDEKIVLDRSKFEDVKYIEKDDWITIYFCDYEVTGRFNGKKFLYGEEIKNHYAAKSKAKRYSLWKRNWRDDGEYSPEFLGNKSPNTEFNCPILIPKRLNYGLKGIELYHRFPILSKLDFHKVFSPEEAFLKLYSWLIKDKGMIEIEDKYKITSHGFDNKKSFRKMKRN